MSDERSPLMKQDAEIISNELQRLFGSDYRTSFSDSGVIFVYRLPEQRPVLTLNWIKDIGEWVPAVGQPPVFCLDDLAEIFDETEKCQEGSQRVLDAWNEYRRKRHGPDEERAWEVYLGARAAHSFRMYTPEIPQQTPPHKNIVLNPKVKRTPEQILNIVKDMALPFSTKEFVNKIKGEG